MAFCDRFSGAVLIASPDGKVTYWSPAAAAEFGWSDLEARELGIQGLFSTADEASAEILLGGAAGSDADFRRLKLRLKSGATALFDSQIMRLAHADGSAYGDLYILRLVQAGGTIGGSTGPSPALRALSAERQLLHDVNNALAAIYASLDLALSLKDPREIESFILRAQDGVRILSNLWARVKDFPGRVGPRTGDEHPEASGQPDHASDAQAEVLEGSERILVAEDDTSVRVLMRAVLTYRGYKVVEAVDGADAVNKYRTDGPFDLVLLDMSMPTLDGPQALEQIRAQNSAALVLALSGTPFDGQVEPKLPAAKFDGFLNKPFHNLELVKLARRVLDQSKPG